MADETELACALGPDARRQRGEVIAGLAQRVTAWEREGDRLRLRFPLAAEQGVRELAAEEARCCGFMDLRVSRVGAEVELAITAPGEAALPTLELFADAFGLS